MKITGRDLRAATAALLADVPEKYAAEALGVPRGVIRYWKAHPPAPEVAEALVVGNIERPAPVKAVPKK